MSLLMPDYVFDRYSDITPEFLKSIGCRFIISDIDNTLAPYEQPKPDAANLSWFRSMEENGIKIALVSNNEKERVEIFCSGLKLPAFYDCKKPSRKFVMTALKALNADAESTVFLGDQIYTDVLSAKLAGIRAIKIPPIKDKLTLLFRVKRFLEIPVMKAYYRRHK